MTWCDCLFNNYTCVLCRYIYVYLKHLSVSCIYKYRWTFMTYIFKIEKKVSAYAKLMPEKDCWIWNKKEAAWRPIPLHPKCIGGCGHFQGCPSKMWKCVPQKLAGPTRREWGSLNLYWLVYWGWNFLHSLRVGPARKMGEVLFWLVVEPPIWKICSLNWKSSPGIGLNIKNVWVATTQVRLFFFWGGGTTKASIPKNHHSTHPATWRRGYAVAVADTFPTRWADPIISGAGGTMDTGVITLPKFNSLPIGKHSSSTHHFSGASCYTSGGYITNPNNALAQGKFLKIIIHLYCLVPPKMGHLMIPVDSQQ